MHVWINTREQSEQLKAVYEGKTKANYACTTRGRVTSLNRVVKATQCRAQYALIPEGESYTRSDGVRICALPDFLQQEMPVLQARQAFSAWDARAGLGARRPSDAEVFTRKSAAQ